MSNLKKTLDTSVLKEKFNNLLENLDRTNTSKMIIERYYGKVATIEISEGNASAEDVFNDLKSKGVNQANARSWVQVASLNEAKTQYADQFLLKKVELLESMVKELSAYSWMPAVGKFINETNDLFLRNEPVILMERIVYDLEMNRDKKYFETAINKLRECIEAENPIMSILENLEDQKWIPLVKRLYEYAGKKKGEINGENPNFKVSRIYSPVEAVDENIYAFFSSGKMLEINNGMIEESAHIPSESFKSLVAIAESAKFSKSGMRIYPNTNSVLDITFEEDSKTVKLNNKVVESANVESALLSGGYVKMSETSKMAYINQAIEEGEKIKDIDFGYRVSSNLFEGVHVNVYNLEDKIYVQMVNKGMKENRLVLAESAEDAVRYVKDFMNYDISGSLTHLLENEKAETERREKELSKIESRIKFLMESMEELESVAKVKGIENSEQIKKAKELLESKIEEQQKAYDKVAGSVEDKKVEDKTNESTEDNSSDEPVNEETKEEAEETLAQMKDKLKWAQSKRANSMHPFDPQKKMSDYVKQLKTYNIPYWEKKVAELSEAETSEENEPEVNEQKSAVEVGKTYTIDGVEGYIYQGDADGVHIFNKDSKDDEQTAPVEMSDDELQAAIDSGKVK